MLAMRKDAFEVDVDEIFDWCVRCYTHHEIDLAIADPVTRSKITQGDLIH